MCVENEAVQLEMNLDYKVKLDDFEGPLDLLLHLIKEAKIDIKNIFVSKITEQYIEYMNDIETVDLERASEFLQMAATLLEIKSKSMLPKEEELLPEEEDEESKLIRQLEEYRLIKEASEKLHTLENVNRFYKAPDESVKDYRFVLKNMTLDGLLDAFTNLLHKVEKESVLILPREIRKDRFTVAERIVHIKDALYFKKQVNFSELFDGEYTKSEIINTFLALLELLKNQFIKAEQEGIYEDIRLIYNEDYDRQAYSAEREDAEAEEDGEEYGT